MEKLKILLADDQSLFAESLKIFLNNYAEDMNVVGIARNGKEAVDMAASLMPDVVLMDIRMPEMDGVEAVRQIKSRFADIRIIMLSTYKEDALVRSALLAGACGYLLKDISPTELIVAVRALKSGTVQISPEVAQGLVQAQYNAGEKKYLLGPAAPDSKAKIKDKHFEYLEDLTKREREIFTLLATGYDNEQIAEKLSLAEQTVRNQVSVVYSKLGVKDRFEIIRLANRII
jgi:DNA-binding NarL/FixJ family response regulator